jgi:hypothetical protein
MEDEEHTRSDTASSRARSGLGHGMSSQPRCCGFTDAACGASNACFTRRRSGFQVSAECRRREKPETDELDLFYSKTRTAAPMAEQAHSERVSREPYAPLCI